MAGRVHVDNSESRGRGVFTDTHYRPGDVVMECPCVDLTDKNIGAESEIREYVFSHPHDDQKIVVALGYCSLANHDDDPNAEWVFPEREHTTMVLRARRDIPPGSEVTISYGNDWWKDRDRTPL